MDRIQALEVFVCVAEAKSFAAGARHMGLSAPSATRGINDLEERLGARLFTRTTRTVRLTDVGETYLEEVRQILSHLKEADDGASGAESHPVGKLRLTCSNEFGRIYIMPILTEFLDLYPDLDAEVLMVDRVVHLVEEGFDLAVRIGPLPSSGLSAIKVGQVRRVICGTPDYFEKYGTPSIPKDLEDHNIISLSPLGAAHEWRFGSHMQEAVRIHPRLVVSSVAAGISVARQGWGLCRVLSYQIGPDLEQGILQTTLDEYEPDPLPIHLVHIEGRRAAAKVRVFLEFAKERLKKIDILTP